MVLGTSELNPVPVLEVFVDVQTVNTSSQNVRPGSGRTSACEH